MNKYLSISLIVFLLTAAGNLQSQIISISGADFIIEEFELDGTTTQDIAATIRMVYEGPGEATLVWEREEVFLERDWETAICDPIICYQPHVNSMYFDVEPNQPFDMTTHLYPNGADGDSAFVRLFMHEENTPETVYKFTYTFYADQTSSVEVERLESATPRLYPNPAADVLNIQNDKNIDRFEIFNVVGRMVHSSNHATGRQIDVSNLQPGLYFVKLFGQDNNLIRTLRLNKQ